MADVRQIESDAIDTLPAEIEGLPFVGRDGDGSLNLWMVESTGDGDRDVDLGVYYAEMAVEAARILGSALIISWVLRDMVKGGNAGMVEIGFISAIGIAAKAGRMN